MKAKQIGLSEVCHFTDRQLEATRAMDEFDYVLYGGSVGGGKSYWLRWALVRFLLKTYKELGLRNVTTGLFCEDYPALYDRHLSKIKFEFPVWLGDYQGGTKTYQLKAKYGGGIIAFRNLDDVSKYQSSEFAAEAVDELTKNQKDVFDFLRIRKRWPGIERTKFIAGSNPGSVGHMWVKKIWMDKEFEDGEQEKNQFIFVPAKATDNPHLPKQYYIALEGLPPDWKKAYIDGNWDLFKGQVFTEWRRDVHVVEPFPVAKTFRRFIGIDFGSTAPFVALWIAVDWDGNYWVYREYYKTNENAENNAKAIVALTEPDENIEMAVADSAIFSKQGYGETIADILKRNGVGVPGTKIPALFPALDGKNTRIARTQLLKQKLYCSNNIKAKIRFFSTCINSIRSIPSLVYDENKVEDVDTKGDDHCLVGETKILTTNGLVRIKNLSGAKITGRNMNVIRLEMDNGKHITCTPNHLILTINGWEEAQSIKINTEIPWLSIKPHKNIGKDDITYVETTFRETEKDYIEKSGQTTLEKYRKNITYIIKTKIKQTIESIILNVSGGKSTSGIILPIRQTNKERQGEKTQLDYAERVISECLKKKEVCRLKKVTYAGKRDLVYDITVDHLFHGFVANGFIVHNCYDALTYAIQKLEDVRVEKPLNSVEEKLFRMKQQKLHSSEYIVNQRFNQNL